MHSGKQLEDMFENINTISATIFHLKLGSSTGNIVFHFLTVAVELHKIPKTLFSGTYLNAKEVVMMIKIEVTFVCPVNPLGLVTLNCE